MEKDIFSMLDLLFGTFSFVDLMLNWIVESLLTQHLIAVIFLVNWN